MKITTKRGMASLYLVAFTTLLLGVVTMSFARVMLNESIGASNSDLSQSAYDAALAGIEDAKTAIVMYNICIRTGAEKVGGRDCNVTIEKMNEGLKSGGCDAISNILGDTATQGEGGEVPLTSNSDNNSSNNDDDLGQAYTCVTISNDAANYQSVLNSDARSRVVPVSTSGENQEVSAILLEWYSSAVNSEANNAKYMENYYSDLSSSGFTPLGPRSVAAGNPKEETLPILAFEFFQTDNNFTMASLDLNNEYNTGTNHAMVTFYPSSSAEAGAQGTPILARDILAASDKNSQSTGAKLVSCQYNSGYRCRAIIELPATYGNDKQNVLSYQKTKSEHPRAANTFLLRVSLPYGTPQTDFAITLFKTFDEDKKEGRDKADFAGTQYIVDSTGRASTLYRRVAARIEANPTAIYPEYAVQVSGNENSTIEKRLYATDNCWSTDSAGNVLDCANNGDAAVSFPAKSGE